MSKRLACAWLVVALVVLSNAAAICAETRTLGLRIAWGGGRETTWHGSVAVQPGRIITKQSLGIETDEPGSMWIDAGQLEIRPRSPREYDGVDVTLEAALDSKLIVTMAAQTPEATPRTMEIPLKQLISESFSEALDEHQNRLLVRRSPGDQLRVSIRNASLVLAPTDTLQLQVQPHEIGEIPDGPVRILASVAKARGGESQWENEVQAAAAGGRVEPVVLEIPAPEEEGVYDLLIQANVPDSRKQFTPGNPFRNRQRVAAERKVQFVVLEPVSPRERDRGTLQTPDKVVDEISPAKPWWKRVTQIPKLPGLSNGPLQHGDVKTWQHPQLGTMVRLGPGATEPKVTWTAYPLSVTHPGQPHIVEVEYAANMPQSMSISLLEPNAAGSVLPMGLDSGIFVDKDAADLPPKIERHRIVFWPRTKDPVVLITNQRDDVPAAHGTIRLLGPKSAIGVAGLHLTAAARTQLPPIMPGRALDEGRLLMAYLERPLIPENFSASEAFDPWSQRSMDDWVTFYDAAMRLTEYLQYAGYNALMISVAAEGSTIYPSDRLDPTPRYDTGIFFSTGQDPARKDVLEMLFRMCDREGLRLIPSLQFSSPLPELETVIRGGGPASVGIEAIGPDGIAWSERSARPDGPSAFYNPLHPRVQQAMLGVVGELLERYRHHSSFAGLAVGTSEISYALLPGPAWPSDPRTVSQFAQEANVRVSAGEATRLHAGPFAQKWLDWRAFRLRQFHGRLAEEVQQARPGTRLFLSMSPLINSPDIRQMLRPALPPRFRTSDALLGIGMKPELYGRSAAMPHNMVLLNPKTVLPDVSADRQAVTQQASHGLQLDRDLAPAADVGSLQVVRPRSIRLPSFDEKSPFGSDNTHTMILPQLVPAGRLNRRRVIQALDAEDTEYVVDGGWMLPLGQEESLRDVVIAYRRLPAEKFETLPGDHQPVTVRFLTRGNHTFLYLLNRSPWSCRVVARLAAPGELAAEELSGLREVAQPKGDLWTVALQPYDFLAVRFNAPNVRVADIEVAVADQVKEKLRRQIGDLVARAASLGERRPVEVLKNPDFELALDKNVPSGWNLIGGGGALAEKSSQEHHHGSAAVRFVSRGNVASLVSDPFPAPSTGRLAFTVWVKMAPDFQGPLRLAVSGRHENQDFYRPGIAQPSAEWKLYEFRADDLPLSDLKDVRMRFDLMGRGEVWIDNIEVSDLRFTDNERTELSRLLTHANFSLQSGKLDDCRRLLDGYWPNFLTRHVPIPGGPVAVDRQPMRKAALPRRRAADDPWWKRRIPKFLK